MFTIQRKWFREFNMCIYVVMPWTALYATSLNWGYFDDRINSEDQSCYSTCSLWYFIIWNFQIYIVYMNSIQRKLNNEHFLSSEVWIELLLPNLASISDTRLLNKQTTKHLPQKQVDGKWEWRISFDWLCLFWIFIVLNFDFESHSQINIFG